MKQSREMLFVIGLGIIFGAAMVVCVPLLRTAPFEAVGGGVDGAAVPWEIQKRNAYRAIKEADLDFQMGKLDAEDYRAIRAAQEARALEALRALEEEAEGSGDAKPR